MFFSIWLCLGLSGADLGKSPGYKFHHQEAKQGKEGQQGYGSHRPHSNLKTI
jgi:hypothetical protein